MNSQDKIDNYIMGRMSQDEAAAFEQQMHKDSSLAQSVERQQEIAQAIRRKGAKGLLKETEAKVRRKKAFKIYLPTLAVAASLAIICFSYVSISECSKMGYGIELSQTQIRGGNNEVLSLIEAKEYKAALALIEEEQATQPIFDISAEEGEYEALQHAQMIEDLEWYKAVTYMRMGKPRKARHCLREIVDNEGYYSEEAGKLLSNI